MEAGSAGPVATASVGYGKRTQGTWYRVSFVDRTNGHHHPARRVPVSCLWCPGSVRALPYPGTGHGWPRRRGRRGGRPAAIDAEKLTAIVAALDGGATKAAACRTFGIKRSTLIDSLARIGWSAGIKVRGDTSDTPTATDRSPDRRVIRSARGST